MFGQCNEPPDYRREVLPETRTVLLEQAKAAIEEGGTKKLVEAESQLR